MADLVVTPRITIPDADMVVTTSRAGGPGGQAVNTTDSRVRLHFKLESTAALLPGVKARLRAALGSRITNDGEIVITGDRFRSRHQNLEDVRERLVELIRAHLAPPKIRRETAPSQAVHRRRVDEKKKRAGVKSARKKPASDE